MVDSRAVASKVVGGAGYSTLGTLVGSVMLAFLPETLGAGAEAEQGPAREAVAMIVGMAVGAVVAFARARVGSKVI